MRVLGKCDDMCCMALGNFDGLHRAHMEVINACCKYAKEHSIKSGVLLFDRHTSDIFGKKIRLLTTMEEKLAILEQTEVDFVHIMTFNEKTAALSGEDFIKYITENFSVKAFFAGYDYSFGKGAKGDIGLLRRYGESYGFETFVTERVAIDNITVSSTAIREFIKNGNVKEAKKFLGRNYFVSGEVIKGFGNGTKSLFPTANIKIDSEKFLPCDGVYAGVSVIDGKKYKSAVNVGKNPTFNARERTVESFLLDFNGEIYGKNIRVEFLERLRPDIKFETVDMLKRQIETDIQKVREIKI